MRGARSPLGATPGHGGVNFGVFSKHATAVDLLLFDHADDPEPESVIPRLPIAATTTSTCSSLG
jgi:pullulanase/glycogen debranching enzyme